MTTMHVVDEQVGETLTQAVSRRLRGQLAELRISNRELGMKLGVSYQWMNRRTNGEVALSTDDLEKIEAATGISVDYLITGTQKSRQPVKADGFGVHPPGLEPGTHWLRASMRPLDGLK